MESRPRLFSCESECEATGDISNHLVTDLACGMYTWPDSELARFSDVGIIEVNETSQCTDSGHAVYLRDKWEILPKYADGAYTLDSSGQIFASETFLSSYIFHIFNDVMVQTVSKFYVFW